LIRHYNDYHMKQVHLYVKGDVIGVGFRAWSKIQAKLKGITGWARNVHDDSHRFGLQGGIEIVAQGEESALGDYVAKIKEGSPISRVDDVEILVEDVKEAFDNFEIVK